MRSFKFLHAADLHLDSPLRGLSAYEGAPVEEIRGATRRALAKLVDVALQEEVDFVLIAGDLFDGDQADYSGALYLRAQLGRLSVPVYLISGNHDAESVLTKSLEHPENVWSFPVNEAGSIRHPDLPVLVHGQGFAERAVLNNLVTSYPEAEGENFNIGLLHTGLSGRAGHDPYAPCTLEDLNAKEYQYWALGHVHTREVVQEDPPVIFPGNIQGRHARETGEKGCYLIEVSEDLEVQEKKFQVLDQVRWEQVEVSLEGVADGAAFRAKVRDKMEGLPAKAGGRLLVLRLILSGRTEWHGELHRDADKWEAECRALAGEIPGGQIWLEKVKRRTQPLRSLADLREQDDLSRRIVEGLENFDPVELDELCPRLKDLLPDGESLETLFPGEDLHREVEALVVEAIS